MTRDGTQAGRIRRHALDRHVEPARRAGRTTVVIRAGDVVRDMRLQNRTPAVCGALGSGRFQDLAGAELLDRKGPWQSTTTEFHYRLRDRPESKETAAAPHDRGPSPRPFDETAPRLRGARVAEQGRDGPRPAAPRYPGGKALWLVSCVKTKRSSPCRAEDLYSSDWFVKARAYAERQDCPWRILSAKYGLVRPETVIAPYEKTLNTMGAAERREWAGRVLAQLEPELAGIDAVVFLAGQSYREFLEGPLRNRGLDVRVPMERLSQGRQLSWLNGKLVADRRADAARFYALLDRLEARLGGSRVLADCRGGAGWPKRGLYFFFEAEEMRSGSGYGRRVVRIGTHALTAGSRSTLWSRLSQHRGRAGSAGGSHRGSIFRLLVGVALARRRRLALPRSWGVAGDPGTAARRLGMEREAVKRAEAELESEVSRHIGAMPFLWLETNDAPGPRSERGFIERNAIALLSGWHEPVDPPSSGWIGHESDRERVRRSGLWNNNHVDEPYDPAFLDVMDRRIDESG